MLEQLRRSTSGILAKILIALLVLSFAVWGIADVFTGYSNAAIATIGDEEISPQEFEQAYRNEIDALSRQSGQRITPDQARAIGLDRQVLSRLIGATAVEAHARALNLKLSDETLVETLKKDPQFLDSSGKFSLSALKQSLAQMGISQLGFLDLRRKDQLRNQITSALLSATAVPAPLAEIVHNWRKETRVVEFATIDVAKSIKLPEPTEQELTETYEQNKSSFMVPEMRQLAVLTVSSEELAKKIVIGDDEIKKTYEQTKETYDTPEQRRIQQIPFPDKAKAEAAKKSIEGGTKFVDVAKEAGATETDIELGLLPKSRLIDKKISDAAFALEKDKVSDVVEGKFTTVLLRVTEIKPGITKTFEDVKTDVRDKLALEQANLEVQTLYDKIDDGRAAGTALKDIAKDLDVPFSDIAAVSSENTDPTDAVVFQDRNGPAIIKGGFDGQIGVESEPVQLGDGGFSWVDVLSVTPPKQKTEAEVKDAVKELWSKNKTRQMLKSLATKAVDQLRNGEDFNKVAEELGAKVTKTPAITRTTIPQGLTQAAITQAFLLPVKSASSAETDDGKSRAVFRVSEIKKADKLSDEDRKNLNTELQSELQRDQLAEYVNALQNEIGVSVNEGQFLRMTGAETQ